MWNGRKVIEQQYIYKAEVDRVVDGDTVDVLLDRLRCIPEGEDQSQWDRYNSSHAQETRQRKSWVWLPRNE